MRNFKFRAWDNKNKEWLMGYELPNLGGFSLIGETVLFGEWGHCFDQFLFNRDGKEPNDLIIEQFTGLKDKNGKEIYEGDMVRTDFKKDGSHESIQVVEFYEGAFGSRNKEDHFRIPALFSGRATEGMNTNYYEVIGNIHQNPELL